MPVASTALGDSVRSLSGKRAGRTNATRHRAVWVLVEEAGRRIDAGVTAEHAVGEDARAIALLGHRAVRKLLRVLVELDERSGRVTRSEVLLRRTNERDFVCDRSCARR